MSNLVFTDNLFEKICCQFELALRKNEKTLKNKFF